MEINLWMPHTVWSTKVTIICGILYSVESKRIEINSWTTIALKSWTSSHKDTEDCMIVVGCSKRQRILVSLQRFWRPLPVQKFRWHILLSSFMQYYTYMGITTISWCSAFAVNCGEFNLPRYYINTRHSALEYEALLSQDCVLAPYLRDILFAFGILKQWLRCEQLISF